MFSLRTVLSLLAVAPATGLAAAQTFHGPIPYLSVADRPAGFLASGGVLEDFEDGLLDFGIQPSTGTVVGVAVNIDSVDADDGVIDGLGRDGHTWFGFGALTITFPAPVAEAGIVWTDGPAGTAVTFEAFGPGMVSLGMIGPFMHSNNSNNGETDEDRFYGVQDPSGIVAIRIHSIDGNQSFEVDHVQFSRLGDPYCAPTQHSGGVSGIQTALGSNVTSDDDVLLIASRLPTNTVGYFIGSQTQGFVANAGGSQGNLCLSGAVSRFNSSVFNSGVPRSGSLRVDLDAFPSPTGTIAVSAGESWNFQCWFRDSFGGMATSNFTNAVNIVFV